MPERGAIRLDLLLGVPLAGIALGVMGRASQNMPDPMELAFGLGVPWLIVSFAAGFRARRLSDGALAGASVLVISVVAYYAARYTLDHPTERYAAKMVVLWGFLGALSGALFGLAGAALHSANLWARSASVGLLAGTLAGEALLYLLARGADARGQALLATEFAIGVALPFVLMRGRRGQATAVALGGAFALTALVADAAIRVFAHLHGWGTG